MKKFIFLILTLAIPVSIFLFLKIFGSNEFEVPVYYEDGIPGCEQSSKPHLVPNSLAAIDELLYAVDDSMLEHGLIYGFIDLDDRESLKEQVIQLVRIQDAFHEIGSPHFVITSLNRHGYRDRLKIFDEYGLSSENLSRLHLVESEMKALMKCGLGLEFNKDEDKLVLVDAQGRIRGIYDGLDVEQTEQLILELKIVRRQAE